MFSYVRTVWTTGALLLAAATAAGSATVGASAPAGIPRDLARARAAQISEVRYHLKFTLIPHADAAAGAEELTFVLRAAQPVLLDFRDGTIGVLSVNGAVVDAHLENGHVIIPAGNLRAGRNVVVAQLRPTLRRLESRSPATKITTTIRSTSTPFSSPWTPAWHFRASISRI